MKYEVRTNIEGRRLCVKCKYKREIKRLIEDWTILYGEKFTYLDIRPVEMEEKEIKKIQLFEPPVMKIERKVEEKVPVINWPKMKSWLEKYG